MWVVFHLRVPEKKYSNPIQLWFSGICYNQNVSRCFKENCQASKNGRMNLGLSWSLQLPESFRNLLPWELIFIRLRISSLLNMPKRAQNSSIQLSQLLFFSISQMIKQHRNVIKAATLKGFSVISQTPTPPYSCFSTRNVCSWGKVYFLGNSGRFFKIPGKWYKFLGLRNGLIVVRWWINPQLTFTVKHFNCSITGTH